MSLEFPVRKCWMKRGQQRRLPAANGPQSFQHVLGALNWQTNQVSWQLAEVKNSETFIAFLEHVLVEQYPTSSLVLVMDNAPYHHSAAVQAALSLFQHRLVVFWLPPYCPTLNPIERFWRHLKDVALANHLFPSISALIANLTHVLSAQNDPAHPLHLSFANFFP